MEDKIEVVAIDPGPKESAWLHWRDGKILGFAKELNHVLLRRLAGTEFPAGCAYVIEDITSFGMPVGRSVFETCRWSGRFMQVTPDPDAVQFLPRGTIKIHLCGSSRAKDPNIRAALIDKVGAQGTKKNPGPTYKIAGDMWSALAIAVVWSERRRAKLLRELAEAEDVPDWSMPL